MYVIVRNLHSTDNGKLRAEFVPKHSCKSGYTRILEEARIFHTKQEAEIEKCSFEFVCDKSRFE